MEELLMTTKKNSEQAILARKQNQLALNQKMEQLQTTRYLSKHYQLTIHIFQNHI
jgi:hypothetical protein